MTVDSSRCWRVGWTEMGLSGRLCSSLTSLEAGLRLARRKTRDAYYMVVIYSFEIVEEAFVSKVDILIVDNLCCAFTCRWSII